MALIQSIRVQIVTGHQAVVVSSNLSPPGTDGDVYLGIGGREFHLDTMADDFEASSDRTYILGPDANVNNPLINDPRSPQLDTDSLDRTPVYIRFAPEDRNDHWDLERVRVTVNPGPQEVVFEANPGNLWLGMRSGTYCYLSRAGVIL
jgi:hypothetical protein